MKKLLLFIFCILVVKFSYSLNPNEFGGSLTMNSNNKSDIVLNKNYQQFKFQVKNFEPQLDFNYANLRRRRKKRQDHTMLYVAGGLAVATGVLILANDPDNFTSNSASGVNMGIAIGGTVACGLFVAKYFIDRGR